MMTSRRYRRVLRAANVCRRYFKFTFDCKESVEFMDTALEWGGVRIGEYVLTQRQVLDCGREYRKMKHSQLAFYIRKIPST